MAVQASRTESSALSHPTSSPKETPVLGELLREARERRGLTLKHISIETKISEAHLDALERNDLGVISGAFYQRAQVRAYARAVHLDERLALAELERAQGTASIAEPHVQASDVPKGVFSRQRVLIVFGVLLAVAIADRMRSGDPGRAAVTQPPQAATAAASPFQPGATEPAAGRSAAYEPAHPLVAAGDSRSASVEPTGSSGLDDDATIETDPVTSETSTGLVNALVVTTEPSGAQVTVNGIGWGNTPLTIGYLPPGEKHIRVTKAGYAAEQRVVRVTTRRRSSVHVALREDR